MSTVELKPGDRVRDRQWSDWFFGTVVSTDGDQVVVRWDNYHTEEEMSVDRDRVELECDR